jgi:hypothetical protein
MIGALALVRAGWPKSLEGLRAEGTKMPGLDREFKQTLERVTGLLAQRDEPDALATLDDLLQDEDEDRIYYAMLIHEARTDFMRILACLDRLEELAETPDKRQWLSQHRKTVEAAQASSDDVSPLYLAPANTGIDDLLVPLIARRISDQSY